MFAGPAQTYSFYVVLRFKCMEPKERMDLTQDSETFYISKNSSKKNSS
jgi:hypothetical protein